MQTLFNESNQLVIFQWFLVLNWGYGQILGGQNLISSISNNRLVQILSLASKLMYSSLKYTSGLLSPSKYFVLKISGLWLSATVVRYQALYLFVYRLCGNAWLWLYPFLVSVVLLCWLSQRCLVLQNADMICNLLNGSWHVCCSPSPLAICCFLAGRSRKNQLIHNH